MPDTRLNCSSDFERCKSAVEVFTDGRLARVETSLREFEEKVQLQFALGKEVWDVRNFQLDKRLDSMNEFRSALVDREISYMTRSEHELSAKVIETDVRALREAAARAEGKASQSNLIITFLIAIIGSTIGIINLIINIKGY
jgi:hypothetical protein